ncbi:MAG TPA: hypothetical protein VE090_03520 [Methylomirabilota bacterium]|nr:hypothetical protein [Methylomirabilota bacterium]
MEQIYQQGQPPAQTSKSSFLAVAKTALLHNKTLVLIGSIVFLILLTGTLYLYLAPANKKTQPALSQLPSIPTTVPTALPSPSVIVQPSPTTIPTLTPINNSVVWKTYANTTYSYTIKYPPTWTVQDLGILEPKIPSYVVFNPNTASNSARSISLSVSSRSLQEQLAIGGAASSNVVVAGQQAYLQNLKDSDGNTSVSIIVPRVNFLLVLHGKNTYRAIFDLMTTTLSFTQ